MGWGGRSGITGRGQRMVRASGGIGVAVGVGEGVSVGEGVMVGTRVLSGGNVSVDVQAASTKNREIPHSS